MRKFLYRLPRSGALRACLISLALVAAAAEAGPPRIDVDPEALLSMLETGQTETQSLTVANLGDELLAWERLSAVPDLDRIGAITLDSGENLLYSAVIDPAGEFAYFGTASGRVVKIDLDTFERVDAIALSWIEQLPRSAVIDPAGEFAYFGTYTSPGRVVKINLDTFERVGAITLDSGENLLRSAVIDPAGEFAYFGTFNGPERVIKIDLGTFERVGAITLKNGESFLRSAVIDPAGEFAYFGTSTSPGRVIKIDLDSFERVGALTVGNGENSFRSAVIDPAGEFAWFGTDTVPGRVVKIDLDIFERAGAIMLESGENFLYSAVIDPAGEFAWFGTDTFPGQVVKIDLDPFQRVDAILLESGETQPASAVIDPAGQFAWFGTQTDPGRVVKIALSAPDCSPPAWADVDPPSGSLPGGNAQIVNVTFNAGGLSPATYEADLCLGSNDPAASRVSVPLSLMVAEPTPDLVFEPKSLDFGDVPAGTDSPPMTSTLRNQGGGDATELDFLIPAGFSADTTGCGDTLPAGGECEIIATFAPAETGPADATLIAAGNESTALAELALSGTGTQPGLQLTPDSLNFGDVPVGEDSDPLTLTLTSTGTAALVIDDLLGPGAPFTPAGSSAGDGGKAVFAKRKKPFRNAAARMVPGLPLCGAPPFTLVPGQSCELSFRFSPDVAGDAASTLTLIGNAPSSPDELALSGRGVAAILELDPAAFSFELITGHSDTRILAVGNAGNVDLDWSITAASGCGAGGSTAWLSTAPQSGTTAPGGAAAVEITASAEGLAAGQYDAALCIDSNALEAPRTGIAVSLTVTAPDLFFVPGELDFGDIETGTGGLTLHATLHNAGDSGATELDFLVPAGFSTDTSACGDTLPASGECGVAVTFAPSEIGTLEGTLVVSGAEDAVAELALSGNGIEAGALSVDPDQLHFENVSVSTARIAEFTVLNTGGSDLELASVTLESGGPAFSVHGNGCPSGTVLAPEGSCIVEISFTPDEAAQYEGAVHITAGDGQQATVALFGFGTGNEIFDDRFEQP